MMAMIVIMARREGNVHELAEEVVLSSQQGFESFVFLKLRRFPFHFHQFARYTDSHSLLCIKNLMHLMPFSRPSPILWLTSSGRCQTWTIGES